MDVQGQTMLATQTQVTGPDAAAGKKGPVQALSAGGGKTEGSISFEKLLVQTIGTGNAPAEAAAGLSAVSLLKDLPITLPLDVNSEDTSSQQILEAFAEQPELAELLVNDENFAEWLVRVSELLQGMIPVPLSTVQAPKAAVEGIVETSSGKEEPVLAIQAQQVMTAFQQAAAENPDSILLAQLTDDLVKLISDRLPEASVPVKDQSVSLLAKDDQGRIKADAALIDAGRRTDASVPTKEPFASVHTKRIQAQTRVSGALADAVQQTVSTDSHAIHLEMLAAKTSVSGRLSNDEGQQETQMNFSVQKEPVILPETGPISVHELLRLSQHGKSAAVMVASTPDTLVQDLSRFVTARFKVNDLNGLAEARLTLTPESLGQVDVKLSMQNGQLVAHFAAQTVTGKEMLEAQLMNLRLALQSQGIQVEKLEVTQNGFFQSGMFQEQRHQQSSQQFTRRNKTEFSEQFQDNYSTEAIHPSLAFLAADRNGFDATV